MGEVLVCGQVLGPHSLKGGQVTRLGSIQSLSPKVKVLIATFSAKGKLRQAEACHDCCLQCLHRSKPLLEAS